MRRIMGASGVHSGYMRAPSIKEALAHAQRSAIPGQPLARLAQAYDCALLMASDCPRFTDTASGWITLPASCG
jgi:hypothetical protein